MKVTCAATFALLLCSSSLVWAQHPGVSSTGEAPVATLQAPVPTGQQFSQPSLSLPTVTPDLWLYSQEWRRHDDPAQAVRRKAEARTAERIQRLAAMKWYGFSNARPQAAVTPFMSIYSPTWVGNGPERYDWPGGRFTASAVLVENNLIQR